VTDDELDLGMIRLHAINLANEITAGYLQSLCDEVERLRTERDEAIAAHDALMDAARLACMFWDSDDPNGLIYAMGERAALSPKEEA